jgi:hypothetical protein
VAKGDVIPDEHHVLRHVPGSKIEQDGTVNGAAFTRGENHSGISVAWREAAGGMDIHAQLQAVRAAIRRDMRPTHRLVELPVGATRTRVREQALALNQMAINLRFEHEPLAATADKPEDPFHSEIFGTPEWGHAQATAIGDLIAASISERYPAIP